ncbi:hypothetical protein ACFXDJ_33135 [Streptomyces sp. NPDC059443]|uniref:hypothetical protein n=1 Tax=unclassified Streptomyces TaxID=2593676 RepID=UPI00368A5CA7
MKLTKRFVTISTAATAAVLLSAGGAQAQDDGEFLSFLGSTTLLQASNPVQVGHGNTYIGTQNINTNNNIGGGVNNNNNNNNNSGSVTQSHDDDDAGFFSLLRSTALVRPSYSVQVGAGNTHTGTQNDNTNNNIGGGTNNNNNNNNNGDGVNNNNNNNNNDGGPNNNNNNNNNGKTADKDKEKDKAKVTKPHGDVEAQSAGGILSFLDDTTLSHLQTCYPVDRVGQGDIYVGTLNISCNQH